MIFVNKVLKNAEKLIFLCGLSICETYYILKVLFDMKASFVLSFTTVVFIATLAVLISLLPKKIAYSTYIALFIGAIVTVFNFIEPIWEFATNANSALLSKVYIPSENLMLVLFSVALISTLINYIFIFFFDRSICGAIASVILICIIYFSYEYFSLLFFTSYISVLILILIRWAAPAEYEEKENAGKSLIVPFALIMLSALILSPLSVIISNARTAPLQWVDELDWFEGSEESNPNRTIRVDGQSTLTELYDSFNYTDERMMIVNSPYIERLRNKTYDTYTRNGWDKAQKGSALSQGYQYTSDELKQILDTNSVPYISYDINVELVAHSQVVFAPINAKTTTEFEDKVYRNIYDDIFFADVKPEGFTYSLEALKIDFSSPEFERLITNSKSENIDNLENYLSITEKMQNELQPLALGLTKDASSNYEKARIIERYLSTQFTYSLSPPEKPDNEDFVEYFLFETKQGFCTHYASSMVMMLRSIGIPCRYVTGYMLSMPARYEDLPDSVKEQMGSFEGTPEDYNVVKRDSHAWVEVWFDDFGWLTFEPTSKYSSSFGYSYSTLDDIDFSNIQLVETQEEAKSYKLLFIIIGSVMTAAAAIAAAMRIYYVKKRNDKEKISFLWNDIKKAYYQKLKLKKQNETAREFYLRADKHNDDLLAAVSLYESAIFSGKEIAPWQLIKMQRLCKKITGELKAYRKSIKKGNKERYKKPEVFHYD